jgi:ABC-type branched-subunit amino acid transport system ATPase component
VDECKKETLRLSSKIKSLSFPLPDQLRRVQILAIGRALMLELRLLLLDEPSLGLSPNYVDILFEKIEEINRDGTAILLVEQNARMALEYAVLFSV